MQYRQVKRRRVGTNSKGEGMGIGTKYTRNRFRDRITERAAPARKVVMKAAVKRPRRRVGPLRMQRGVINAQAGRASMKFKGKLKKPAGHKAVKVSKTLRAKVKEVMKENEIRGTYTKVVHSPVGVMGTNDIISFNSVTTSTQANLPAVQDAFNFLVQGSNGFQGSLMGCNVNQDVSNGTLTPLTGGDWNYFTTSKFLDAASVLFNRKTGGLGYQTQTGNMSVRTDSSSGSATLVQTPAGIKIDVLDSYVTWEMKNTSARSVFVEVFACQPKTKFIQTTAMSAFRLAVLAEVGTTATSVEGNWSQPNAIAALVDNHMTKTIGVDPNAFEQFAASWTYEKSIMLIKPGETCTHKIQGPKKFLLDYNKWTPTGGFDATQYINKFSVSMFMRIYPDLVTANKVTAAGSAACVQSGFYCPFTLTGASNVQMDFPIATRQTEVFKLAMPEPTGFAANASIAAGGNQTLNLRKPTKVFVVFPNYTADLGNLAYSVRDEENSGLANTQSPYV